MAGLRARRAWGGARRAARPRAPEGDWQSAPHALDYIVPTMRRVALVPPVVALLTGCGVATRAGVPPVLDIPVPPAVSAAPSRSGTGAAGSTAPARPTPAPAPWVTRAERTEATRSVARCQIAPFTFSSTLAVETRLLGDGRLALRVVQDDEKARGVAAQPGLLGKGYVVEAAGRALHVHGADGEPVPEDQVSRIRALAAAFLGWPGADVAAHPPAAGAEVVALEGPVAAVADVPLHGAEVSPPSKIIVRLAGTRRGDGGDELVLDVSLAAMASDAGMCHRWTREADVKGELRLRASNGALLGLHLEGPSQDSEGLCQDPSGKPGPAPPPHTCNRGQVTVDVKQPRVP